MGLFRGIGARKDAVRGTSPIETRKVLAGLFASTGGISARPGILPGGTTPLVTGNSTWAYNVGLFHAFVSRGAGDGGQVYGNDGTVLIGTTGVGSTVPIAPGTGLQRIDIVWTRHPTNTENTDTSSEPLFGVASGVAASSSPTAPSIPAGALELGRNTMTSAATNTASTGNTIAQSAPYTGLRGGPVLCHNQAERDVLALFEGLQVYRLDLHLTETYNGTSWVGPPGTTMGTPTYTPSQGTSTSGATETLDAVLGTYTFTAVAGRRYRAVVEEMIGYGTVAGDVFVVNVRNGGASTPTAASACVASTGWRVAVADGRSGIPLSGTFVPGAGTVTLGVFAVRQSGTGYFVALNSVNDLVIFKVRELYAVDMGPA